ncbi:hypothetical protein IGI04_035250 [Brassica rapa subsp. trilocularis]|uniref:BTB domain-containing protein n=1 Tax=Brassica rapa subsp. trilocularis TaxID=1813537 RepID=A0ABQ7LCZ8_BRACM|nr:hypothetical protein IGI04_035250 [Brassica rapa subsp. trilocularis]
MGSEHNNQQKEGTDAIGFITEHVTERSVKLKVSMQKTADEVIGCQGMEEKNAMALEREGFVMGSHTSMSGERDNRSRNSRQSNSSWVLRNQNKRRAIGVVRERSTKDNEEGPLKHPVGLSGGLALFWRSTYEVEVLSVSNRIIDIQVKIGALRFFMSFIYGDPVRHRRHAVWEVLRDISLNSWWLVSNW